MKPKLFDTILYISIWFIRLFT